MLYNLPFVPGKRMPIARCEIGNLVPDAASIVVKDTTHIERTFTSGYGGGTKIDFKGYTLTGSITAYVKRTGLFPDPSANLPERFSLPFFKLWVGGYYAEGYGAITDCSVNGVTNAFTVMEIAFESDGHWIVRPNVVELF